jgi:excisionase family DNA binding protein
MTRNSRNSGSVPDPATVAVARALLLLLDTSPNTVAAHVADAIQLHRRRRRLEGASVPAALEALGTVFATVALESSRRATADQEGSVVADRSFTVDCADMSPDALVTTAQAATRMNVSPSTVKRRAAAGVLVALRHGRVVRFRIADIDSLIAKGA